MEQRPVFVYERPILTIDVIPNKTSYVSVVAVDSALWTAF